MADSIPAENWIYSFGVASAVALDAIYFTITAVLVKPLTDRIDNGIQNHILLIRLFEFQSVHGAYS